MLTIENGELKEDRNGSKNITMYPDVMMKVLSKNVPLLVSFVDCFLTRLHSVHDCFFIFWNCDTDRALHLQRSSPMYPSSASSGSNCDAREAWKILRLFHPLRVPWTTYPENFSTQNGQSNLISNG